MGINEGCCWSFMRASEVALFKNTVYELYYMFGLRLDLFLVDLSNYI